MASLLERVRERRLLPWMLAYLAGAWLVLRLVDVFGPRLDISDAAILGIDAILVIGFFITLVVAWYHGEPGRQQPRGMELVILTILLLIAAGVLPLLVDEPFVVPDEPEAPGAVEPDEPGGPGEAEEATGSLSRTEVGRLVSGGAPAGRSPPGPHPTPDTAGARGV